MNFRWARAGWTVAALGMCLSAWAKDNVSLSVSASRQDMYLGESVVLTVRANGADDARRKPDLSALSNCDVEDLGSHSVSRQSIQVINGHMTRQSFSGREFTYRVTPRVEGTLQLGPVRLPVETGRPVSAPGPTIRVTGVQKQSWVSLDVRASRESVLVDEPFTITLAIRLRPLSGRYADSTPLNPSQPPVLTIPYIGKEIEGLDGEDMSQKLQSMLVSRPDAAGFAVNDITSRRDPFDDFFSFSADPFRRRERACFDLPRRKVDCDGKPYWEYVLKLEFVPRHEGDYTFGPVLFKGPIVAAISSQGRASTRNIFAVGSAATVRVVPPPEEGRPESYVGVLGSNLTATASLDTQTCNVGDPLTLTLTIAGDVNLDELRPPAFWEQEDLLRDFRFYQDTLQTKRDDDAVTYSMTVRPLTPGTIELPPIPVSFYNSRERDYQTVTTDPIPMRVNQVDVLRPEYVINIASNAATTTADAATDIGPVAPLDTSPEGYRNVSLLGGRVTLAIAATGPLVCLLAGLSLLLGQVVRKRSRGVQPRQALPRARQSLKRLLSAAGGQPPRAAHGELARILRQYVAERLAGGRAGLTPSDCRTQLEHAGIPPALVNDYAELLDDHFNAAFVASTAQERNAQAESDRVESMLRRLDQACRAAVKGGRE